MKFILLVPSLLTFCFSIAQSNLIQVTDMLKQKQVGNVQLTNDGSKAAFTVMAIEPDPVNKSDYRYVTQLYMVATSGNAVPKQLTTAKENASQPSWSPDGKTLAFVRAVDGKPQIFLLSMDGGEAVQLTKSSYGASNPKWSPDGKTILFSAAVPLRTLLTDSILNPTKSIPAWAFEKPGFEKNEHLKASAAKPDPNGNINEIRAYLLKNEVDNKAKVITRLNFQDEANINAEQNFTYFFTIKAEPGSTPTSITSGFNRINSVDFSGDGKQLILTGLFDSVRNYDRVLESQIALADLNGRNIRILLSQAGRSFYSPLVSPSGKWMVFFTSEPYKVNIVQLAIISLTSNTKDYTLLPFDRGKNDVAFSTDEKSIYFTAQSNGGTPLYKMELASKKIEQLSDFNAGITSFDLKNNILAFAKVEVADPSALYISDVALKSSKKIGHFNDWVKEKKLSYPEKKTFTNEKGQTVEYWVMKPTNYEQGKKYPVVLEIHGGPSAMWGPGEASMWHEYQFFCSQGYGVVYSNPRGSGGYGEAFLRANINDWGAGPSSDVLTALDGAVKEGWIDTSKLTITGGSYAGYLVAWIISHDKRFKAACSQRGVYDLATFFGEGNAWRLVPNYFGGYPWEPQVNATLVRESPINYVQNITTPYIIFHGDNDRRTGFVQSEMLYRSLKVLGRPVEYVRHPGGTHELTRSGDNRQRIDQMLRTYEFFERFIR